MTNREPIQEGRRIHSVQIGEFTLLNSEKLGRVMDLLEGVVEPTSSNEATALQKCKSLEDDDMQILALYDRLGGGIRLKERKLNMGVFWNFKEREPNEAPDLSEEDFEDEFVLVRKQRNKGKKKESVGERVRRFEKKATKTVKTALKKATKKSTKKTTTKKK